MSGGTLTLSGTKSGLNVFAVSADTLAAATSLVISVPSGAGALVNVSGPSVAILNKGVTLQGVTAQNLLFNFPGASFVQVSGVGLSGSLLAPDARLTFDSGSITGTIVVRSFQSSGSGSLLSAPLNGTLLLGSATPSAVLLTPAQPLLRGCSYVFGISSSTPLTSGGNCLASPVNVTFTVAPHPTTAGGRELEQTNGDQRTQTLRRFAAKSGINTPVSDVWSRYESDIGVSHSAFVALGNTRPSVLHAGKSLQFYQQYQLGYPVFGHGFLAEIDGGIFRQALGRATNILPSALPTPVSSSAALQAALQYLHVTTPPWVSNPSVNKPPVLTLGLLPVRPDPGASDFKLVWDVEFANTGIAEPRTLQLDAASGSVIRKTKAARGITYLDPKTAVFTPPLSTESFNYAYDNTQQKVDVARYTLSSSGGIIILGSTLANDNGATTGVLETFYATQPDFSDARPIIDSTPVTPWSAPTENSMAAAQWGVERADKFFKTLGFVSTPGNPPWTSVDGLHRQKVVVRWLAGTGKQDAKMVPGDAGGQNAADYGFIDLTDGTPGPPIERDTLPHEFDHLFQFNLRAAASAPDPENIGETGSIQEGLADLFGIGSVHQQFGEIDDWQCVSFGTNCDRDLADPLNHSYGPNNAHPDFYEGPNYGSYTSTTNCPDDDDCFVHRNSTVISHWGYLLARGTGDAAPNTCGLDIDPLDLNTETAFRYVIDISHLAYGGLLGFPTPAEPSFADFRDATLVTARDMADAGTVPPDTVQKFELAWYAVGLGPEYQTKRSPSLPTNQDVVPNEEATSVYPWTTFEWQSQMDGLTGNSWDFQITDSSFDQAAKYEKDGISETVVENGVTKYVARVALPFNTTTRYYWRVRPAAPAGTPWLNCYPVHSFVGTTTPDVITGSEGGDLPPGINTFIFSPVNGAVKYEVYVSAQDSNCQAGTGVQQFEAPTNWATLSGIQPQQHYWVEVLPIGPDDFTKQPSVGTCFKAQYNSAALEAPMPTQPLDTQIFDYHGSKNHPVFGWSAFNQPDHYLIQLFLRDQNGNCATTPQPNPIVVQDACNWTDVRCEEPNAFDGQLPSPINPTGYCWNVIAVAKNGNQSPPSVSRSFVYAISTILRLSPGSAPPNLAYDEPNPLAPDSYNKPVTFSWTGETDAVNYGIQVGPWPFYPAGNGLPQFPAIPSNCIVIPNAPATLNRATSLLGCNDAPIQGSLVTQTPTLPSATFSAADAGLGRYCWKVWPVVQDPTNPAGLPQAQPYVQYFPLWCYTTGPGQPKITIDNKPDPSHFTATPITGTVFFPYIPDGQYSVHGSPSGFSFDQSGCKLDAGAVTYADFHNCTVSFTLSPKPDTMYEITASTWNSDQHPPVTDDSDRGPSDDQQFQTAPCGDAGEGCCANNVCNSGNLLCKNGTCTACGDVKEACCANSTCNSPYVCNDGTCAPCGERDGQCCPKVGTNRQCADTSSIPGVDCFNNKCLGCGLVGQGCCYTNFDPPGCQVGMANCVGNSCYLCGNNGQACCTAGPIVGRGASPCAAGLTCFSDAKCHPCGEPGLTCCQNYGPQCFDGSQCGANGMCPGSSGGGGSGGGGGGCASGEATCGADICRDVMTHPLGDGWDLWRQEFPTEPTVRCAGSGFWECGNGLDTVTDIPPGITDELFMGANGTPFGCCPPGYNNVLPIGDGHGACCDDTATHATDQGCF